MEEGKQKGREAAGRRCRGNWPGHENSSGENGPCMNNRPLTSWPTIRKLEPRGEEGGEHSRRQPSGGNSDTQRSEEEHQRNDKLREVEAEIRHRSFKVRRLSLES